MMKERMNGRGKRKGKQNLAQVRTTDFQLGKLVPYQTNEPQFFFWFFLVFLLA